MPRQLTFSLKRKKFDTVPVKVDRRKLYGWTEIVAVDDNNNQCQLFSTDDTGAFIISRGGTGLGILSSEGRWVERSSLKTVREDGKPAKLIPSSFNTVTPLKKTVTEEEFLNYSITDFYQLTNASEQLIEAVGEDIYTFPYTYLDSYEASTAFLMAVDGNGQEKLLFMLIGVRNVFEMLCFGDCGEITEDYEDAFGYMEDDDDLDFSMF